MSGNGQLHPRTEHARVRRYLQALHDPGAEADPGRLRERIDELQSRIDDAEQPIDRLMLIQRRLDVEEELSQLDTQDDLDQLEVKFVEIAANYAERKGLTWPAWREAGVPAQVLRDAGIAQTRWPRLSAVA